jgi:hypothetical protein
LRAYEIVISGQARAMTTRATVRGEMQARRRHAAWLVLAGALALAPASIANALVGTVARPRYAGRDAITSGTAPGTVFFLATPQGPVAVGAGHTFDRAKLAAVPEVVFELARSGKRAGVASRVLVGPGLSFSAPGGSLRTDLAVFPLEAPPAELRVLHAGEPAREGQRVRLLGIPPDGPHDEDDIFGTVDHVDRDRLEVKLDVFYNLNGWGGAPIVSHPGDEVVGVVQGATPDGKRIVVTATPIAAVQEALGRPLDNGHGRAFAALGPPPTATAAGRTAKTEKPGAVVIETPAAPQPKVTVGNTSTLLVDLEQPGEGAIYGDDYGAFVAGRASDANMPAKIEVVFVIDTSGSTADPSGMDVNGNGIVGDFRLPLPGTSIGIGSTDPGDSVLAAEIAAALRFVSRLDPRRTRVCIVTFAGQDLGGGGQEIIDPDSVLTEVALTEDFKDVERALQRVLQRGPAGATYMSGGADMAIAELLGLKGSFSSPDPKAEKLVVFLTDGQPTLPAFAPVEAVIRAARRAHRAGIRFFTYGIGKEALTGPLAIVKLAEISDGAFTPVSDPRQLADLIAQTDFASVASVTIRNTTMNQPAFAVELGPDGSFGGLVPLQVGKNQLLVTATSSDGKSVTKTVMVHKAPGAVSPPVPQELVARRNRLLEERLVQLKRLRVETEEAEAEQVRKDLAVQIDKERAEAKDQAERQRKELKIKVDKEGEEKPPEPQKP